MTSKNYVANVPGFYIIGCAYHYSSDNMRTVIIVQ
jgi:plastocyanin